jgi:hypothetical protein
MNAANWPVSSIQHGFTVCYSLADGLLDGFCCFLADGVLDEIKVVVNDRPDLRGGAYLYCAFMGLRWRPGEMWTCLVLNKTAGLLLLSPAPSPA